MKEWKLFNDECTRCGNVAEVFTDADQEGYAYDGDDARCVECGLLGNVSVGDEKEDGDCIAYIDWNDYED